CPGLDPGWTPVFGKACPRARPGGSCSNNKVERDGGSKNSHLARGAVLVRAQSLAAHFVFQNSSGHGSTMAHSSGPFFRCFICGARPPCRLIHFFTDGG